MLFFFLFIVTFFDFRVYQLSLCLAVTVGFTMKLYWVDLRSAGTCRTLIFEKYIFRTVLSLKPLH